MCVQVSLASFCGQTVIILRFNRHLPRDISLWLWQECTGSHSSGESSRRSFHRSASPGGSWARKWHLSSSALHAGTQRSYVGCSCTAEPLPSEGWDQLHLKDSRYFHFNITCIHLYLKYSFNIKHFYYYTVWELVLVLSYYSNAHITFLTFLFKFNSNIHVNSFLPLAFLVWMNDFPSTCHVGLYNSSISICHLSGSRYFMTSSTVLSSCTASDSSSMSCRDGGRTAGALGSDTLCGKTNKSNEGGWKRRAICIRSYNRKCIFNVKSPACTGFSSEWETVFKQALKSHNKYITF